MKYLLILAIIFLQFQILLQDMSIRRIQTSLNQAHQRIAELKFHTKEPCMSLPSDAKCSLKTVHFKMPGGSLRKEIRRVCGWSTSTKQEWKENSND